MAWRNPNSRQRHLNKKEKRNKYAKGRRKERNYRNDY